MKIENIWISQIWGKSEIIEGIKVGYLLSDNGRYSLAETTMDAGDLKDLLDSLSFVNVSNFKFEKSPDGRLELIFDATVEIGSDSYNEELGLNNSDLLTFTSFDALIELEKLGCKLVITNDNVKTIGTGTTSFFGEEPEELTLKEVEELVDLYKIRAPKSGEDVFIKIKLNGESKVIVLGNYTDSIMIWEEMRLRLESDKFENMKRLNYWSDLKRCIKVTETNSQYVTFLLDLNQLPQMIDCYKYERSIKRILGVNLMQLEYKKVLRDSQVKANYMLSRLNKEPFVLSNEHIDKIEYDNKKDYPTSFTLRYNSKRTRHVDLSKMELMNDKTFERELNNLIELPKSNNEYYDVLFKTNLKQKLKRGVQTVPSELMREIFRYEMMVFRDRYYLWKSGLIYGGYSTTLLIGQMSLKRY